MSINPDYVTAPYETSFMLAVTLPPAVRRWSRKRRLRWRRHYVRKVVRLQRAAFENVVRFTSELVLRPLPVQPFVIPVLYKRALPPVTTTPILFQNRFSNLFQACDGDVTEPHTCHHGD